LTSWAGVCNKRGVSQMNFISPMVSGRAAAVRQSTRVRLDRMSAMLLLAVLAVVLGVGCASSPEPQPYPDHLRPAVSNLLQEGDVLQIVFPGATDLNTIQKVPLDGVLQLPFAGPIPAAGKTTQELQDLILERYGTQLQLQEVTVTIQATSATIYVSGAVLRPGRIPIERPLTALEAVMEAGGLNPNRARPSRVVVIRHEDGQQVTYRVDLGRALSGKRSSPFYLRPFDIVHVPAKTFRL
jgi:polysaccharide biosynthesis/export protein